MNHECSTQAVFLCTAVKLQCWPMLAHKGTDWRMLVCSLLHFWFIGSKASVVQSSSWYQVLSIGSNPWAGLGRNLGNHRKTLSLRSSVHLCLFSWEGFPRQACINQVGKTSLFYKGCVSVHSCQTAIVPHVGTVNSAYWALSTFQSGFIWAISFVCSIKCPQRCA